MMLRCTGWSVGTCAGAPLAGTFSASELAAPPPVAAGALALSAAVLPLLDELAPAEQPASRVPATRAAPTRSAANPAADRRPGAVVVVMSLRRAAPGGGSAPGAPLCGWN